MVDMPLSSAAEASIQSTIMSIRLVMKAVSDADTRFTILLLRRGIPEMWNMSLRYVCTILSLWRLYPVYCRVAPRTESMMDPASPASRPASSRS